MPIFVLISTESSQQSNFFFRSADLYHMNFFSYNNCFLIFEKHHMVTYFLRKTLKLYANYDIFRRITQMSPNHENKPRVIMDSSTIF